MLLLNNNKLTRYVYCTVLQSDILAPIECRTYRLLWIYNFFIAFLWTIQTEQSIVNQLYAGLSSRDQACRLHLWFSTYSLVDFVHPPISFIFKLPLLSGHLYVGLGARNFVLLQRTFLLKLIGNLVIQQSVHDFFSFIVIILNIFTVYVI